MILSSYEAYEQGPTLRRLSEPQRHLLNRWCRDYGLHPTEILRELRFDIAPTHSPAMLRWNGHLIGRLPNGCTTFLADGSCE
jgi:hypothetical protein